MSADVHPLQAKQVQYKGLIIKLTHRPKTNDWTYTFTYTHTQTVTNTFPRYETALKNAKKAVDMMTRGRG